MNQLPPGLAALAAYPQFIIYKVVHETSGKLNKVPLNHTTLGASSALDSSNWMSADAAFNTLATRLQSHPSMGLGMGFTLTKDDPFACVDLDKCFDANGQWKPVPGQVMSDPVMAQSGVEISVSGTGAHAWFQYQGVAPPHGCKDMKHGLEMYSQGRFIALTGDMLEGFGSASKVVNPVEFATFVSRWFPVKSSGSIAVAATNNVPQTRSDGEVIEAMLNAPLKAAMAFGAQATPEDLWVCNVVALSMAFPVFDGDARSDGLTYDASSADMALASHLAYHTGGCAAQVERLMRQSAMARLKWDTRADYLAERTIGKACAGMGPESQSQGGLQGVSQATTLDDMMSNFEVTQEDVSGMKETEFIYEKVVPGGHLMAFVGEPGCGKTTVGEYIAAAIAAAHGDVYYTNADIAAGDIPEAFRRAQKGGYKLICPDIKVGMSMGDIVKGLVAIAGGDENLEGKVFFFDTLKTMTDVINKTQAKSLYQMFRKMTARGATVICMAHANKYRDDTGIPVYEGTGDLRSDFDELALLFSHTGHFGEITTSIYWQAQGVGWAKARASVEPLSFTITPGTREVTKLDKWVDTLERSRNEKTYRDEKDAVDFIKQLLVGSPDGMKQGDILDAVAGSNLSMSRRLAGAMLRMKVGGSWTVEEGPRNSKIYRDLILEGQGWPTLGVSLTH